MPMEKNKQNKTLRITTNMGTKIDTMYLTWKFWKVGICEKILSDMLILIIRLQA